MGPRGGGEGYISGDLFTRFFVPGDVDVQLACTWETFLRRLYEGGIVGVSCLGCGFWFYFAVAWRGGDDCGVACTFVATTRTTTAVRRKSAINVNKFSSMNAPGTIPRTLTTCTRTRRTRKGRFGMNLVANNTANYRISDTLIGTRTMSFHAPFRSGGSVHRSVGRRRIRCFSLRLSRVKRSIHCNFLKGVRMTVMRTSSLASSKRIVLDASMKVSPALLRVTRQIVVRLGRTRAKGLANVRSVCVPTGPPCQGRVPICHIGSHAKRVDIGVSPGGVAKIMHAGTHSRVTTFAPRGRAALRVKRGITTFLLHR